jgi:hypothetical protein
MSARIVLNFSNGLAECAIDRGHDGGTWLSLWQGTELVLMKVSMPSLAALQLLLARHLAAAGERGALAERGRAPGAQGEPPDAQRGPAPTGTPPANGERG